MDKKALEEKFEEFARWYALPLYKSEDGIYRALETQSAWMSFQHQQAKVEELQTRYTQQGINMLKMQKRMELALGLLNTNNEDFPIKLIKADLNKVLRLEQALNEGNND